MEPVKVSPDEATRQVETLLNLKREKILTDAEVKDALTRVSYYSDIVKAAQSRMARERRAAAKLKSRRKRQTTRKAQNGHVKNVWPFDL